VSAQLERLSARNLPLWSASDSEALYATSNWSDGFFGVSARGHAVVRPRPDQPLEIDIPAVIEHAREHDIVPPMLIRFQDVLRTRVRRLVEAFTIAIAEAGYSNRYQPVYPIKVNQLHEVVDEVLDAGKPFGLGLECGSRAELLAALPYAGDERLLLCTGVKDPLMLSTMLSAQELGQQVLPVIEKCSEFEAFMALADRAGRAPRIAVRIKLSTEGSGRWFESGGERSKFGLTVPELVRLAHALEVRDNHDAIELLHFHLGSQICDIHVLKEAIRELTQIYADLRRRGLEIPHIDVGGGLGVDYGASYDDPHSVINYSLQEYANAVVHEISEVCRDRSVPEPVIVSESGRAITAHHSVLVVPVLGSQRQDARAPNEVDPHCPSADDHPVLQRLARTLSEIPDAGSDITRLVEAYHDVQGSRSDASALFRLGHLDIETLARVETAYWTACREVLGAMAHIAPAPPPPEQQALEQQLTETYLCDFSIFQSVLDHWAIGQRFPIMPLTRLTERPTRRAIVVDLTCDSDGKISEYVSSLDSSGHLPLHDLRNGESYMLGIFLVGAYQDILGDSHNLFGRLAEVHVYADAGEPDNFWIEKVIPGMTVDEMLAQVQYFPHDLKRRMSELVRRRIDSGETRPKAGMSILNSYARQFGETTYCTTERIGNDGD